MWQATRLAVIDMIRTFIQRQESNIAGLLRHGLLHALGALLPEHHDVDVTSLEVAATLMCLASVLWHPEIDQVLLQQDQTWLQQHQVLLQIWQWCENILQDVSSVQTSCTGLSTSCVTEVMQNILRIFGGMHSRVLPAEHAAAFMSRNQQILIQFMDPASPLRGDACSVVLISLRSMYSSHTRSPLLSACIYQGNKTISSLVRHTVRNTF